MLPKKGKQNKKNPLTKRLSRLGSTRPVPPKIRISSNVSREASGDQQVLVSWVGSFRPKETNSQTSSGWRSRFLIRYLIANSIALLVTAKASKADTCTIVGKEGLSGESATAKRFYVHVCLIHRLFHDLMLHMKIPARFTSQQVPVHVPYWPDKLHRLIIHKDVKNSIDFSSTLQITTDRVREISFPNPKWQYYPSNHFFGDHQILNF